MSALCTLPPETTSVAAARRFVQDVLEAWGLTEVSWSCLQLTSELATNAVIHARTDFTVEVSRDGHVLRVCVRDGSPAAPGVRRYGSDATTGRGMRLVESMAADWGVARQGAGKTIWFAMDTATAGSTTTWDDGAAVDLDDLLDQLGAESSDDRSAGSNRASSRFVLPQRPAA